MKRIRVTAERPPAEQALSQSRPDSQRRGGVPGSSSNGQTPQLVNRGAQSRSSRTGTRIFLLSPANAAGIRGRMILRDEACFTLALRLRHDGLPLGELFSFISGLYFRGKLAYARAFAQAPPGLVGAFIITASRGLVAPEETVGLQDLQEMLAVPIDHNEPRYREPLERDSRVICHQAGPGCEIVLLGSIATPKYVDPLLGIFGERLLFPSEFVGRGDMSRGGLMLRCVDSGTQLTYVPVSTAVRHGPRPPRLSRIAG